ncbi:hypothetical protein BX616_005856 [Lobosporangium transversale]|nr:hypothetical protein BX616_005856 [Lobosporangium transversale]
MVLSSVLILRFQRSKTNRLTGFSRLSYTLLSVERKQLVGFNRLFKRIRCSQRASSSCCRNSRACQDSVIHDHQPVSLQDEEEQRFLSSSKLLLTNSDNDEGEDDGHMPSSTSSTSCSFPPILLFAVPGAIYFFNNNLTFVLLSLMPAPTYVVLSNLKILTTGLFSYLFLHRLLTSAQWISLGILFLSTAVSQIDLEKGLSLSISIQAFLLMILFCSLSAAASVFSEYVMKERFANESIHLQNMKLYMFGILFNGITYMLTPAPANSLGSAAVESSSFFSDTAPIHFMIIMAYASLGLVTSAIIKFSGSITKVYASSMSMFFAALVSWLLLNDQLTVLFFVGCFGCCFALHLYYRAPVPSQAPESTTSLLTDDRDDGDDDDKEEPRRDSSSSYASSTTLAASPGVEPTKHKNINSPDAILTSVTVVDRNEYFSLDTLDDGGKRPQ